MNMLSHSLVWNGCKKLQSSLIFNYGVVNLGNDDVNGSSGSSDNDGRVV